MPRLHEAIYRILKQIPEGTVATYGDIAAKVDTGPRQVGRALRETPEGIHIPWHRVVNAKGEISIRSGSGQPSAKQRDLLEAEGITFEGDRVDLSVFRWEA